MPPRLPQKGIYLSISILPESLNYSTTVFVVVKSLGIDYTHMISLGGDGTSSEIVSSIHGTEAVFGIIPGGSLETMFRRRHNRSKAAGIPLDTASFLNVNKDFI